MGNLAIKQFMAPRESWDSETIFHNGDDYFAALLRDLREAKSCIKLETYIFTQDELGEKVLDVLSHAVERGVQVDLLVDGVGSILWNEKQVHKKINVVTYHPVPKIMRIRKFWRRLTNLNRRDHRKLCVIDKSIAYVGSLNIDAKHLKSVNGKDAWRDTGVRVQGKAVAALDQAFDEVFLKKRMSKRTPSPLIKLNDSRLRREQCNHELIRRVNHAQQRVWITVPYFIPPLHFIRAMCSAARKDVDVRLLLTHKVDHIFMYWVNSFFYGILLRNNVRIFEYLASMLHAKTRVIDNWVTVGSSNKNYRSFFNDLELDVVLTSESSIKTMEEQFNRDLQLSKEIKLEDWNKRFFIHRAIEKFLYLFRWWL